MAENAIGILFEVMGQGSIKKESGSRIKTQIQQIVDSLNKDSVTKIRFQIDSNFFKREIEELKRQMKELSDEATISPKRSSKESNTNKETDAIREAKKAISEYYKLQSQYDRKSSRTNKSDEYEELANAVNEAKLAAEKFFSFDEKGMIKLRDNVSDLAQDQRELVEAFAVGKKAQYETSKIDTIKNAESAWANLTQKVHNYIDTVEFSASRNKEAADMLKDLRDMANNGDYHGYDELKKKLGEVEHFINKNSLATETWGQKMIKTFGSRVRSALAGIMTAKIGQWIHDVYQNVVNLDKALVNLQIASGKNREETRKLIREYSDLAKTLGATTEEVANAADTWLRQGYSAKEASTLIKNSMMLAKLGQMESTEASTALTSAMKGYGVAVEDSISIVDKFTKVDMEAAASAGDIATAMAETSASARIAGISMDTLIGYIATVKEVTQDSSESVGTFFKTLFARMNNVAAGNFIDEETGEALNDVEIVLNNLGIALRNANGEFRNSGEVINEVASRWGTFNTVQQHAIATAFAGTRQQEKFLVLMQNYESAMEYATIATESSGTATEKFSAYTEGLEGSINSLKASFEKLSQSVLDSDLIKGAVGFLDLVVTAITKISDLIGGLNTVLFVTAGIIATIKADSIISWIGSLTTAITSLMTALIGKVSLLGLAFKAARSNGLTMGQSIAGAFKAIGVSASAAQVAVGALVAVLGIALIAINAYNSSVKERIDKSLQSSRSNREEAASYKETAESIDELIDRYHKLSESNNGVFDESAANEIRNIQQKITDLVGEQADNIDLVNGKLDEQLGKLQDIAKQDLERKYAKALTSQADAEEAYKTQSSSAFRTEYDVDAGTKVGDEFRGIATKHGVQLRNRTHHSGGAGGAMVTVEVPVIVDKFDNIEDFIKQYDAVSRLQEELAADENRNSTMYSVVSEFISDYKEIYEEYTSAKELADAIYKAMNDSDNESNQFGQHMVVALKSAYSILEEVQEGYDGLSEAMSNVTSEGYLTADALSTLFKLEEDNALAGLKLSDILIQDAKGYKLAGDALQQYVKSLIEAYKAEYTASAVFLSQKDKENAITNLKNLMAILATISQTQDDANAAYKRELNAEKELYEDQLDRFEELIDLRKEIIKTYKEEIDYQRELEKKQKNVTDLQTKLSVARLDTSAAGRARVRELESQLADAQEDLDDFTLEHAIDVITSQLESESAEWKSIIQDKLDNISRILDGLDVSPNINITTDTSWVQEMINSIVDLITKTEDVPVYVGHGTTSIPAVPSDGFNASTSNNLHSGNSSKQRWTSYQDAVDAGFSNIFGASASDRGRAAQQYGSYQAYLDAMYKKYMGKAPVYHSGGFVGGDTELRSNEEFAKLLKGEFVSTPSQMKRFMEQTLPSITSLNSNSDSNNEFNAPLIEIVCENVTSESIPSLKEVVDSAVKEIKKQLDSGMSRTGYKKQIKSF